MDEKQNDQFFWQLRRDWDRSCAPAQRTHSKCHYVDAREWFSRFMDGDPEANPDNVACDDLAMAIETYHHMLNVQQSADGIKPGRYTFTAFLCDGHYTKFYSVETRMELRDHGELFD